MATFRKLPSGRFQARVSLKGLRPLYSTFTTKTKARQWASSVEADTALARSLCVGDDLTLDQAVQVDTNTGSLRCIVPSFGEFVDDFLADTQIADKSMIGRVYFWKKKFNDKLVINVTAEEIDDALLQIDRATSGSNANRYKSNLSSVFIVFNRHPSYKRLKFPNPVRSEFVSSFRENSPKTRFLSPTEQRTLLKTSKESHWDKLYLLVLMALTTGARRGELLKLTWDDLELTTKVAYLRTTKNSEPRLLPLLTPVIHELGRFTGGSDHLIFPSTTCPLRPFDFKKAWHRVLKDAGISNLRFHDLRHTAASNMVGANRTLFETGVLLGHKQASTTMRYAHLAHQHTSKMAADVWSEIHED